MRAPLAIAILALTLTACKDPEHLDILTGSWGGPGSILTASPSQVSLTYPCKQVTIPFGVALGDDGAFAARGERNFSNGTPTPQPPDTVDMVGSLNGSTMLVVLKRVVNGAHSGTPDSLTLQEGFVGPPFNCP